MLGSGLIEAKLWVVLGCLGLIQDRLRADMRWVQGSCQVSSGLIEGRCMFAVSLLTRNQTSSVKLVGQFQKVGACLL